MVKKNETKKVEEKSTEALATVAPAGALAVSHDYGDDAGMGNEDAGKGLVPWIVLLQSNSPQVEEKLVAGAEAGMLLNSSTQELIQSEPGPGQTVADVGLLIQPVYITRSWVEWIPREKGGGVAARYPFDKSNGFDPFIVQRIKENSGSEIFDKKNPMRGQHADDNTVVDTRYFYFNILSVDGQDVEGQGVMACSGSKIGPVERLFQAIKNAKGQPPAFATIVHLTTFQDKQKKPPQKVFKNVRFSAFDRNGFAAGLPYAKRVQNFKPETLLDVNDSLYQRGRDFYQEIKGGSRKADYNSEGNATGGDRAEGENASNERAF